jgi:hypothetical protein
MFFHSSIVGEAEYEAHGHRFCIWVTSVEETRQIVAFICRLSPQAGDPVPIEFISAKSLFGVRRLIETCVATIEENRAGLYAA